MKALIIFFFLIIPGFSQAQSLLNLDFEEINSSGRPVGWTTPQGGFLLELDSSTLFSGRYSLSIKAPTAPKMPFGACSYVISSFPSGQVVKLTGRMKTENVDENGFAGIWLRLDGEMPIAFDNMQNRRIVGTTGWTEYSIELHSTPDVKRIVVGGILTGAAGSIWLDDFKLYIDDREITSTTSSK